MRYRLITFCCLIIMGSLLAGCGGGGGGASLSESQFDVSLSANPIRITAGGTAELEWSATGASSVSSTGFTVNGVKGKTTVSPTQTTTYTVTAKGPGGSKTAQVIVTVTSPSVSVQVSPNPVTLVTGGTQKFSANVAGTSNTAVRWTVEEGCGTITQTGDYTAPNTSGMYQVTATSLADSTKSATATVIVTVPSSVSVQVSPSSVTLVAGGTQKFSANVSGTSNTAVRWTVESGGGSITEDGDYTAPNAAGTYKVTATSLADSTKSATATVIVTVPSSVSVQVNPSSVTLVTGGTQKFSANVSGTSNTAVRWTVEPGGGSITEDGDYTAPDSTGTYKVTATSLADSSKSASATVTVKSGNVDIILN